MSIWIGIVVLVDLLPILYSTEVHMTMSLPILLAAGMIFAPLHAGLIAFVGSVDIRHWRREIALERALFNRSQVALSCMAASWVFHALGGKLHEWPEVLLAAVAALGADGILNVVLVTLAAVLYTRGPVKAVASQVLLGSPVGFALSYLSLASVGTLLALAASDFGLWGLLVSTIPVVLARQAFALRRKSALAAAHADSQQKLLAELEQRIADERRDERTKIAMSLHDEVLATLYQVHLMSEVLHQDLASGQLLAMEEDLPALRKAAGDATESIRAFIRNLRTSALGAGGLITTLRFLIDELSTSPHLTIRARLEDVGGSPWLHLLLYQIAREALRNAVRHSGAKEVVIELFEDDDVVRLIVTDKGCGFVPAAVHRGEHFGLEMMHERAELAGGVLLVQSDPGSGTQVIARLPLRQSPASSVQRK